MSSVETIDTERIAHSPLGASGSGRWMNCPGSIQLQKKLGIFHTESGFAAKEGTAAHEVLAQCLADGMKLEPLDFLGRTVVVEGTSFEVDQKMVEALNVCYNHVYENMKEARAMGRIISYIEVSMQHSKHELMFGTTDCAIVAIRDDGKVVIWVNDLKYGQGIVVEPTTSQIKYYATLVADRLLKEEIIQSYDDIVLVYLTIMQPRIPHTDGLIRTKYLSGEQLYDWYSEMLVPAMKETENPDAVLQMGDWCTFCPVKTHCPAMATAVVDFSSAKPPEEMDGDELGRAIMKLDAIIKLKERYEAVALKKAMRGEKIYGKKLVKQKANRKWREGIAELMLIEQYGEEAYTKKLKGIPDIEKLPDGKTFVAQYAFQPTDSGLTLAPLSDNRKEAKTLMAAFEDFEDGFDGLG